MLQPLPVRPIFRALAAPLGIFILLAGCGAVLVSIAALHTPLWWVAGFAAFGLALTAIGVLLLILAVTGALPEWVVGGSGDREDPPRTPDGR